jgi:hypothetical protein
MSHEDGKILINCQDCNRTCLTVEVGKVVFSGIGMSVRCVACETVRAKHKFGVNY